LSSVISVYPGSRLSACMSKAYPNETDSQIAGLINLERIISTTSRTPLRNATSLSANSVLYIVFGCIISQEKTDERMAKNGLA
jgi:hypothetical protein